MADLALQYGYLGLFVLSFVAATIIAAPSDILAMAMPSLGYNVWWVGVAATIGGFLGNVVNYAMGRYGTQFVLGRWFSADTDSSWYERARALFQKYGVYSLLLSGLPFIGDPITIVAGAFQVNRWTFVVLVLSAKIAKFAVLLGVVSQFGA